MSLCPHASCFVFLFLHLSQLFQLCFCVCFAGIPSKSKDNLGQATPSMVAPSVQSQPDTLAKVSGVSVTSVKPLTKGNLEEKLKNEYVYVLLYY